MNSIFQIQAKELVIINRQNGSIAWNGKPKGLDVEFLINLPTDQECIVLLNWFQADAIPTTNLLKMNTKGEIVWEVSAPQTNSLGIKRGPNEIYSTAELQDNFIVAFAGSGFLDYIRIDDGTVARSEFYK